LSLNLAENSLQTFQFIKIDIALHFVWHLLKDLVVRTAGSYLREQSLLVMVVKLREH